MIRLTEEEREYLFSQSSEGDEGTLVSDTAKAQLKKVYDWGNEPCPHHTSLNFVFRKPLKRHCPKCWQALLKGIEK